MNQAAISLMTSATSDRPRLDAPVSLAEFNRWLPRAQPGQQLEYHRGHLIWDRSPASELTEDERRALARFADTVFQAADQGQVHLVQVRNGPFDFSYLAIRAARSRNRRVPPAMVIDHVAAQRSTFHSEAA